MKISVFIKRSPIVPIIFCGKTLEQQLTEKLHSMGLNLVDGMVIASIFFEARACRPSEIASALGLSRSQVSQSVKRLQTTGFVERSLHDKDARALNLRLTSTGRSRVQKVVRVFDELTRIIEGALGTKDSEMTAARLESLRQNFSRQRGS